MLVSYLELETVPERATVWDKKPDHVTTQEVYPVRFKDGSIGLLPQKQAEALGDLVEYLWEDELMSYNQHHCEDDWTDEPIAGLGDDHDDPEGKHIIWAFAAIRTK